MPVTANDPEQLQETLLEAMKHARKCGETLEGDDQIPTLDLRIMPDSHTDPKEVLLVAAHDATIRYARVWVDPQGVARWEPLRARCRFCGERAVAVFDLDRGCVCHPDDREQALCMQHVARATPLGEMLLRRDLTSGTFTKWWNNET